MRVRAQRPRQPEVAELDVVGAREEDVCRLEIAVEDRGAVDVLERRGEGRSLASRFRLGLKAVRGGAGGRADRLLLLCGARV